MPLSMTTDVAATATGFPVMLRPSSATVQYLQKRTLLLQTRLSCTKYEVWHQSGRSVSLEVLGMSTGVSPLLIRSTHWACRLPMHADT